MTASPCSIVGAAPSISVFVGGVPSVTCPEKSTVGSAPRSPEMVTESRPSDEPLLAEELVLLPQAARATAVAIAATGRRMRRVRRCTGGGPSDDDTDCPAYPGLPKPPASAGAGSGHRLVPNRRSDHADVAVWDQTANQRPRPRAHIPSISRCTRSS